jgi:hypothetical protein
MTVILRIALKALSLMLLYLATIVMGRCLRILFR